MNYPTGDSMDDYVLEVQSKAHQTIQNCQTSSVDFQPYLLYHKT
jgi:hypothetical protein